MDSTLPPAGLPATLPEGRFSGRVDFADMVRRVFVVAAEQGWHEITVSDPDFADWPLGDRAVADALNTWARGGRKFTMLAGNYGEVMRRHARFVTWRRTWAHIVDCRANSFVAGDDMPSALLGPAWVFERLDVQRCTGVAGGEASRRVALRERLQERLLKSTPAFAATTLGL